MADGKADLVLHEGLVFGRPGCDSLAVAGDRIVALGSFRELKSLVSPRTRLIPLDGRMVAPGFIDSHLHFLEAASVAAGVGLSRCRSLTELLAGLRLAAGKTPPGNWLRVFGCDEALLSERRGPTRAELDQAVPKNPLRLRHQTLHASWLNSRAVAALGLEQPDFAAPEGARLWRDSAGRLTGLVVGMEEWLGRRMPVVTRAELEARVRLVSRELASAGVTGFTDAGARNGPEELALFAEFVAGGLVAQRVGLMLGAAHAAADSAPQWRRQAASAGIRLAGIKFIPRLEGGSAGGLAEKVAQALVRGFGCAFHVTEVDELECVLAALEKALPAAQAQSPAPAPLRIEHGGVIPPDQVPRLAALGAWVVTNPGFIYYRGSKYLDDPGLASYLYPARTLLERGIRLAGATDAPVTPARPLSAMAAAVTRLTRDGVALGPDQRLTRDQAFALFTSSAASLFGVDAGEVSPGRLADLVVLEADPLSAEPGELAAVSVDLTIIGGRLVYERSKPRVLVGATFREVE
ncbi:MAG: amidohydrolase [Deltaproteobacteria bacterium]|nr:amidohydrolase [Deltaproteobacteria bacterium]